MLVSVIIPTLNEGARIEACLRQFGGQPGEWELIVADGGSGDGTVGIASSLGARVVCASPGRGGQMNAGAAEAKGDILLFLHADAMLPPDSHGLVCGAMEDDGIKLGCFWVRHEAEQWRGTWKARWLRIADLRSRWTTRPYGDQGLFLRREDFQQAGGFPGQPLMEELELARRLSRMGRVVTLPAEMRVSARRFESGWWRAVFCLMAFPLLFRVGVTPERLIKLYGHPR